MNSDFDTAKAWADIVIQRWESKITQLNIVETTDLLRSFTSQVVVDSKGDPEKIIFTFLYYGIFPDMGVGKGVTYDMVPSSNRTPKPWYSKKLAAEVHRLAEIMAEKYGEKALDAINLFKTKIDKNDEAWKSSSYNN